MKGVVIAYDGDSIVIGNRRMRVKTDGEYTYKLQKTQIRAIGGAKGLCENVKRWLVSLKDVEAVRIGSFALIPHEAHWAMNVINHIKKFGKMKKDDIVNELKPDLEMTKEIEAILDGKFGKENKK